MGEGASIGYIKVGKHAFEEEELLSQFIYSRTQLLDVPSVQPAAQLPVVHCPATVHAEQ